MKRGDVEYLASIIDAVAAIKRHKEKDAGETTERAIIYELITIGEAANKIDKTIRAKYANIPWSDIIGFRNILIHNYLGIDTDTVWHIVNNNLEELGSNIREILNTEF